MANADALSQFFKFIDEHQNEYVKLLADAVAIPSVSSEPDRRGECVRMAEWLVSELHRVGATYVIFRLRSSSLGFTSTDAH